MSEISETFWAYFAGLFDGEGSISTNKGLHYHNDIAKKVMHTTYNMNVSGCCLEMLTYCQKTLNMGKIYQIYDPNKLAVWMEPKRRVAPKKICYQLRFNIKEQKAILPHIIPYLHEKKTVALNRLDSLTNDRLAHKPGRPKRELLEVSA